ncbi:MAG TPA: fibronectin type III domain-containing protein [Verrucomicrobiota bacterium]|nr:fibronectin type III domain-containing protein [Verrucomicrobiota bacterium]
MFLLSRASWRLALGGLAAFAAWGVWAENTLVPTGVESPLAASLPGDQVFARAAFNAAKGFVVWQDNFIDGDGSGIGIRRLDRSLVGELGSFRVNAGVAGNQDNPQIAMLKDGGAVVVWQGGTGPAPRIYGRFLAADGTFATGDLQISTYDGGRQENPQVAVLSDGSCVVAWASYGQDGSYDAVVAQRLSAQGQKVGAEFIVNERTLLNQRSPAVAALAEGRFAVAWISEKENRIGTTIVGEEGYQQTDTAGPLHDVSVMVRVYDAAGPVGGETQANQTKYLCANPVLAAGPLGGFVVAWSSHVGKIKVAEVESAHGWDVAARAFGADGQPTGEEKVLNERTFGDQYLPGIVAFGRNFLSTWNSLGQDGSREGVYARVLSETGVPVEPEFQVNTTTAGPQKLPSVAADDGGRVMVVWSSAMGGVASFDLFAQRYAASEQLQAPGKPFVSALSSSKLSVAWPDLSAIGAVSYEVYVDGATAPVAVSANYWTAEKLQPARAYSIRLSYVTASGARSPLSEAAVGTTWGVDDNFDGLPDDWQEACWKTSDPSRWPGKDVDTDGDGATNLQEFLAGTNPLDPAKVLRLRWTGTPAAQLHWNTEKGSIYQVEVSHDLKTWTKVGAPRFAADTTDGIAASQEDGKAVYRVIRVR